MRQDIVAGPKNDLNIAMYEKIAVLLVNKVPESRDDIIPDRIRLPDGREFAVTELTDQVTNREIVNRARREPGLGQRRPKPTKYSMTERQWIVGSTVSQVGERYNLEPTQAYNLINNSRMILGWNRVSRRDMR